MLNVKEPNTQSGAVGPDIEQERLGGRRWPIIRGRSWRVVLCVSPLGVRFEVERIDHAQS